MSTHSGPKSTQGPRRPRLWLTASRWAMDAMGASVDVNALRSGIRLANEPQYVATASNLAHAWAILGVHALVWGTITWIVLRRRRG